MLLILFMVALLVWQVGGVKEGLTTNTDTETTNNTLPDSYKPYDNNIAILAQQNAGNIQVLKGQIDDLNGLKSDVSTMQQSISSMQTQLDGLVQQQADYAQSLAGSTPATISGTTEEDDE